MATTSVAMPPGQTFLPTVVGLSGEAQGEDPWSHSEGMKDGQGPGRCLAEFVDR